MSSYFGTIKRGAETVLGGLKITIEHFARATKRRDRLSPQDDTYFKQPLGLVTIQYPSEAIPTPPFSRYRLHNDAADCIALRVTNARGLALFSALPSSRLRQHQMTLKNWERLRTAAKRNSGSSSLILIWQNACTVAIAPIPVRPNA
jgi:hypothetical protein